MRNKDILRFTIIFFVTIFLSAIPVSRAEDAKTSKIHFPKLKNYKVELNCLTQNLKFKPGKKAKITFGLKNVGANSIICYEWKMDESQNLSISYAELKNEKDIKDAVWQKEAPLPQENPRLMPLELAPNNNVLIDKELSFVEKISPDISSPMVFYIYAELNLESISAKSPTIKIVISP